MIGYTFDTGALIALERGKARMRRVLVAALEARAPIHVPTVVLTEWWRGQRADPRAFLAAFIVEEPSRRVCLAAGEACAAVSGATAVDAIVMASAALRGDVVYTSDLGDLAALHQHFTAVAAVLRA